jgi:chromosomal replication initiator protein
MTIQLETRVRNFETEVRHYLSGAGLNAYDFKRLNEIFERNQVTIVRTVEVEKIVEVEKKPKKEPKPKPTRDHKIEDFEDMVSDYMGVRSDVIRSRSRKREVVIARQIAMYLSKEFTKCSLKTIGTYFGRDHTSVIYAIQTVKNLMDTDPHYRDMVQGLVGKMEK